MIQSNNHLNPKFYEGKTTKELQKELTDALSLVKNHPQFEFGWINEYIQELKRRIAETIGKVKLKSKQKGKIKF